MSNVKTKSDSKLAPLSLTYLTLILILVSMKLYLQKQMADLMI